MNEKQRHPIERHQPTDHLDNIEQMKRNEQDNKGRPKIFTTKNTEYYEETTQDIKNRYSATIGETTTGNQTNNLNEHDKTKYYMDTEKVNEHTKNTSDDTKMDMKSTVDKDYNNATTKGG